MITISIINSKGGVGKSLLNNIVSQILFHQGKKVAVIDADYSQHTIYKQRLKNLQAEEKEPEAQDISILGKKIAELISANDSFDVFCVKQENLDSLVSIIKNNFDYDYLFIDSTGSVNVKGVSSVLSIINYFFVPTSDDEEELDDTVRFYELLNKIKEKSSNYKKHFVFFNRVKKSSKVKYINLVKAFESYHYSILKTFVYDYVDIPRNYRNTFAGDLLKTVNEKTKPLFDLTKEISNIIEERKVEEEN